MSKPLAARFRDDEQELNKEIVDRTTYDRVTVLFEELRNGYSSTALRKINDNPPRYHIWRLNENYAYCNDFECGRSKAIKRVERIRKSPFYSNHYERDAAEKLWPGDPYRKHPSYKGPATGGVNGP